MSATPSRLWASLFGLAVLWVAAAIGLGPTGATVGAAATAALVLAVLATARMGAGAALSVARVPVTVNLRDHARRTGVLRQRDPDAAGRPRPRAPGSRPSAA
jgi:hypothetical protein